jgi:hypothetical protein
LKQIYTIQGKGRKIFKKSNANIVLGKAGNLKAIW